MKWRNNVPYTFPLSCIKMNGSKLMSQWKCAPGLRRVVLEEGKVKKKGAYSTRQ